MKYEEIQKRYYKITIQSNLNDTQMNWLRRRMLSYTRVNLGYAVIGGDDSNNLLFIEGEAKIDEAEFLKSFDGLIREIVEVSENQVVRA